MMKQNSIDKDFLAREKFQQRISKGMIGPGSDSWGLPDEVEIIAGDTPLQRYFSGILFPESDIPKYKSQDEIDIADLKNESDETAVQEIVLNEDEDTDDNENLTPQSVTEVDEERISKNSFFPTNIGLSVCLPAQVTSIQATFSFGLYHQPKQKEIKIKIPREGYESFFDDDLKFQLPFQEILKYEEGYMYLERELKGFLGGKKKRSGEYVELDNFLLKDNIDGHKVKEYKDRLELLSNSGRLWKRSNYVINEAIELKNTESPIFIDIKDQENLLARVGYNVKILRNGEKQYAKIQFVNLSDKHPANQFSNRNETLNRKCIFQAHVSLQSEEFLPYRDYKSDRLLFDEEEKEINFIYRSVTNYSIGHNCSTAWNIDKKIIQTTFLPVQDVKDVTNSLGTDDKMLQRVLDLKNLSVWGLGKEKTISNLNYFIKQYENWILNQEASLKEVEINETDVGLQLVEKQKKNLNRLRSSLEYLNEDEIFQAFQIANTAMYIQLIISNDADFGNREKELAEASTENLNSLEFFKNYDSEARKREQKIAFTPSYRPFQLAFLLLNIEGIVDPRSKARREIVDLIWFPTGGGKTEAYLAVTALTIVYRRLKNVKGYEGTTVIMRYTLRLLTAQQFERASKLITTLEFLRKQQEFSGILKDETISIGLWVGIGSTPNELSKAKEKIDKIENESNKRDRYGNLNGNPEEENIFQISSCPWCGTKLITKRINKNGQEVWKYGFKKSRRDFKIKCNNEQCTCSGGIPVQVIDELLYEQPPTLLFGTVDKFAMLAWKERAHRFFNSHDDELLPPDLIIQDELHLLSGPLGSITGIFESIIEILSTKKDRSPKIIASTATTRNTEHQVRELYGKRRVNVFPPSGIDFRDSFFARQSDKSKRRYIGFLPTGKTSVDTQLQILAHLLVARIEVYFDTDLNSSMNNYWTLVSYYNSLKDLGRAFNKVGDEISTFTSSLQNRLLSILGRDPGPINFNHKNLYERTKELTSRIESNKIKSTLNEIEKKFNNDLISHFESGYTYIEDVVDLVLATNMISVGIDIGRLNIMLMNGMPKNVAEYIQATSRVGRNTNGLVVTLLNSNRAREMSYFENFNNFHQAYYQSVEPLSLTPFTESTVDKMVTSLIVSYVRNKIPNMAEDASVVHFEASMLEPLKNLILKRFDDQQAASFFTDRMDKLATDWENRVSTAGITKYKELLKRPSQKDENQDWVLMQSMREIDGNTFIRIKENNFN